MNFKNFKIPLLLLIIIIVVAGFIYIPRYKMAITFKEAMAMENIEYSFIHMGEYLPTKTVNKSNESFEFPRIENISLPSEFVYSGTTYNILQYLDSSYTQGLIIIKNDTIQYENYWRGQAEDVQHISWSMAKSFVSALFGIAMEEGYIKSVDQVVEEYLPALKDSGYEGVKIKDVLQMATGVKFDETYSDPKSDINRYWNDFIFGKSQDEFAGTLINQKPPGTYNHYVSINTHVLGMIIVSATGKSLTEYLQEKIWEPIGAEFDAYWLLDGKGMEMALGGLNACLRDYAKLGRLYLNKGNWNGTQIVPAHWIEQSVNITEEHLTPHSENSAHPGIGYGYQWWIPEGNEGEFLASGVFNQYIYINPSTNTVIVKNSANKNYYDGENPHSLTKVHIELFRKLAQGRE